METRLIIELLVIVFYYNGSYNTQIFFFSIDFSLNRIISLNNLCMFVKVVYGNGYYEMEISSLGLSLSCHEQENSVE